MSDETLRVIDGPRRSWTWRGYRVFVDTNAFFALRCWGFEGRGRGVGFHATPWGAYLAWRRLMKELASPDLSL